MLGLLFLGAAEVVDRGGTAMSGPLFARFTSPAGYSAGQEAIAVALPFGLKQEFWAWSHAGISGFMHFDIYMYKDVYNRTTDNYFSEHFGLFV